jgi:hypothetical protein
MWPANQMYISNRHGHRLTWSGEKRTHGAPPEAYLVPARPGDHQLPGAGGAKEALLPSAGCHTLVASFQLSLHVNMGGWDGYKARQTAGRAAVRRGQSHRGWQALV